MKAKMTRTSIADNAVIESIVIDLGNVGINDRYFDCRIGGEIKWLTFPEFLRLIAGDIDADITLDNDSGFEYKTSEYKTTYVYEL